MKLKTSIREYLNENKYWSNSKITEYKRFIGFHYSKYYKEIGLPEKPLNNITTVGSLGTDKFVGGKSDVDFMLHVLANVDKQEMIQIVDYLNSVLIDKYGEIEGKGGTVEVIGINNKFWFE